MKSQPVHPFRQPRLLIVGCGDVGLRLLKLLQGRFRVWVLTSSPSKVEALRTLGAAPILGNLDQSSTLSRLAGLADYMLHLAPPPTAEHVTTDPRSAHLAQALSRRSPPRRLVYGSTTGVYGDCQGEWVAEHRPVAPATPRAQRRVHAEHTLKTFGLRTGTAVSVLRIPGIYAHNREGSPSQRLQAGTPSLNAAEDGYTNHVHADDLARACLLALFRGQAQRSYHICEDSGQKTGDYYDTWADHLGLPRPPRISRAEAEKTFSPMRLSFLNESRRLVNVRAKRELGWQPRIISSS